MKNMQLRGRGLACGVWIPAIWLTVTHAYAAAQEQPAVWNARIGINLLTDSGPEYTV